MPGRSMRAPDGTNPNTPWGWVIAFWPIVSLLSLIPTFIYLQGLADIDYSSSDAVVAAILSPTYVIIAAAELIEYALLVLFSALDYRALTRTGVPQPFHWAWSFLSGLVYVIGRGVVVKRRTGRGLAPMWVFISLEILIFVLTLVITVIWVIEIAGEFSSFAVAQVGTLSG